MVHQNQYQLLHLRPYIQTRHGTTSRSQRCFLRWPKTAVSLYLVADKTMGEKIQSVDVTSEYPWVNKYGTHPIGHTIIIYNPEVSSTLK